MAISQSLAHKVPGALGWRACEFSVGVMREWKRSEFLGCFPKPELASFLCLDMVYLAALLEWGGEQGVFRHQQCLLMQPQTVPCPSQRWGPGLEQGELPSSSAKQSSHPCSWLPMEIHNQLMNLLPGAGPAWPHSCSDIFPVSSKMCL